ncbi:hypothetical protein QR680_014630 [Steinernema hermaphroditum]|uniref:Uncharacterized protein n=1 Tax=Steinernema hermaphroditum TaxID=289476 RepID=A0AA39IB84_9BILA|nr:hypothetical protein QR680_014630 [Steinernema hermaphroditum]
MIDSPVCPSYFETNQYFSGQWAIPEATTCFHEGLLRVIPSSFLFLTSPVLVYRFWSVRNVQHLHHSQIAYAKIVCSLLVLLFGSVDVFTKPLSSDVSVLFPVIFLTSLVTAFGLTVQCVRKGVYSSGVIFCYSLILVVCSIPQLRHCIEKFIFEQRVIGWDFTVKFLYFASVVAQAVLHCFSDYDWSHHMGPRQSPELKSSFLSQHLYSWFTALISKGYKTPLTVDDVYSLNYKDKSHNVAKAFLRKWNRPTRSTRPRAGFDVQSLLPGYQQKEGKSIVIPFLYAHKWETLSLVMVVLSQMMNFLVPYFLERLIDFTKDQSQPAWVGLGWASCLFITAELLSLITRAFYFRRHVLEMNISSTLISLIYTKALSLSNEARRGRTVGEIVNFMSIDVEIFKEFVENSTYVILMPIMVIVGLAMLYNMIGVAALVGVAVLILLVVPASYFTSSVSKGYVNDRMRTRDERVKMTNEFLTGIKTVKMHAWEDGVQSIVEKLRDKELSLMTKIWYLAAFLRSCYGCIHLFVTGSSFATFILIDPVNNILTPEIAFVTLALFEILYKPIFELPFIISSMYRFGISNQRLKSFLSDDELEKYIGSNVSRGNIELRNASFTWEQYERPTLRHITMTVKKGELVAVVGEVGSGKSSLVSALLGEMTKKEGTIDLSGTIAYVPQQAWIQNATLKDNITFGSNMDKRLYAKVVEACALTPDLEMLPAGDATEIGERGINISGGQKQRICVARAVYAQGDIYLLDDPLSAVDAHIGRHLFDNVISTENGILKDKTRILVTHNVHFLKRCDKVIALKHGQISEQGTYHDLMTSRGAFYQFMEEYAHKKIEKRRATSETVQEEVNVEGPDSDESDDEQREEQIQKQVDEKRGALIGEEKMQIGEVNKSVYVGYLQAASSSVSCLLFLTFVVRGIFQYKSNIWLADWSESSSNETQVRNLEVYIGLTAGSALFNCLRNLFFALAILRASALLHDSLLKNVLRLPMSFFDTTPLGRILNRFGKDIETSDDNLPIYLDETCSALYDALIALLLVIRGSFYAVPFIVVILVLNKIIINYYIRTSRQLRRLESVTRSPIFSHFQESLQGVSSIRAYRCEERFLQESNKRTDTSKSMFYFSMIVNQWLVIRLEFMGALLTLLAALVAVFFRGTPGISAGIIGLAISNSFNIGRRLTWTVRMMSGLENNIVSVERIFEYTRLPQEAAAESDNTPSDDWPQNGTIEFQKVSLRYRDGLDLVLKEISLKVTAGEKIGIVGRTGAGKSSLSLALYRIVENASGKVIIDEVDVSQIGLKELRSRLTIVPQDPVLFSGSIRMNLDPCDRMSEPQIWEALEVATIKGFVASLPRGLNYEIEEGGANLSVGQRQLICLARAVLHKTKILILDEAAAALDLETDAIIQKTIREHFKECTVLTIAHRLNTVLDYDRILVLDAGEVKEFDCPKKLLEDTKSLFYSMAKEAGLC